ncbi:[protein-PII] uridylyltransferase [Paraneptunicella aestuarii]|uniref:[protein-PII] uridylyltransferase n=1 Tax=Paraneptunicella aestuarii TaxID=2831148 RepID=UPI001E2D39C2|nr:[protein-PII] uridylyltransferase [Paraneptunicella aestuarii]UAA39703.1 [protein-PII] uridylyltransferase [Paraneptunicella aestuarii]
MSSHSLLSQIQLISSVENREAFKTCIANCYDWLTSEYNGTENIVSLVEGRAAFVDALLCHIWRLMDLHQQPISLIAVGGYGRGHLQPYSDIDLLILSKKSLSKDQQEKIQEFITLLWDIGLDIGQSVRTINETFDLARKDITIATNLIESRLLIGDHSNFEALQDKVHSKKFWSSQDFFLAKYEEQQNRHAKFNDTSYNLEPNVKENPGCLRDIQTIGWVAKKHFHVITGKELVEHGYFTEDELTELHDCRKKLWDIRFTLHLHTKRNENRLLFDYQADIARKLGYYDEEQDQGNDKPAVEKMMREFFRVIRRVAELNGMLLQHFKQDILPLKVSTIEHVNDDFELRDGLLYPLNSRVFDSPIRIMAFFKLLTNMSDVKGLHSATLRLLRNGRRAFSAQYFCEIPECRELFLELVKDIRFFGLPWDLMHKHGIMQAYLPQWDHIVGMMQFDLFHAYTVDEHTHRLIKQLAYFADESRNDSFPRCGRIINNMDKPELLFIAGIFHDIAKGRGGDHSKLGAKCVTAFAEMHNLEEEDTKLISWLVENHLVLSVVAQRRDIYDPEVIQEFATAMRNQNFLDHLYVLTLADIRATNDTLWNDWKSSLLRELYLLTSKALENGLQNKVDLQSRIDEHRKQTRQLLTENQLSLEDAESLWAQFPDDYFIRFKPAQIAWHTQSILKHLAETAGQEGAQLVDIANGTLKAGTEMILFCKDRPALFAQTASVLDSKNCSIHDAQICALNNGYIFDSFIVLEHDGGQIQSESRLQSLRKAVQEQLNKPGVEHKNQRRMPRQLKQLNVPTKVRFFSSQPDATMLELEALDAPGLLAKIGHLFVKQNLTLKVAKITTIGERAEDLFIISNQDGKALSNSEQVELKNKIIELLSE